MEMGWRAKIGQIRPASAVEGAEEWRAVNPVGVAFADARTTLPRIDREGLRSMMSEVLLASRQLATAHVDLIVQCGAPGTFLEGPDADQKLKDEILRETGVPAVTMQESHIEALKALDAKTVAVGTIYDDEVNDALAACLEHYGFKVLAMEGLQITEAYGHAHHDADSSYKLGRSVQRKAGNADAILISCGAYRSFATLKYLEEDTGTSVVSSNQSTLWWALRSLGLKDVIPDLGRLWHVA